MLTLYGIFFAFSYYADLLIQLFFSHNHMCCQYTLCY